MEEEILVFPTRLLDQLGNFRGFCDRMEEYLPRLLEPGNLKYMPRRQAERDPRFKQLLPYIILRAEDQVFCYQRGSQGAEHRLHQFLSLGVGGHVCKEDGRLGAEAYEAGFHRELDEEVAIDAEYTHRIVGMVHDDRTAVGEVHFGIVHLLDLEAPRVTHRDPALSNAGFQSISEIVQQRDRFESWSQFVIEHVLLNQVFAEGSVPVDSP